MFIEIRNDIVFGNEIEYGVELIDARTIRKVFFDLPKKTSLHINYYDEKTGKVRSNVERYENELACERRFYELQKILNEVK